MYPQPARSKRSILLAGESSCRTAQGFRWTASMTCAFSFGNHGAVVKNPHNWKMAEMRFRISAIQRVKKPRRVCRPQTAKKYNHFLSRHVRERKYRSGCRCIICPSQTDKLCAQQTANLLSEKPGGIFRQSQSKSAVLLRRFLLCRGKGVRGVYSVICRAFSF